MTEVRTLDRFFTMLDESPDRAFYGWKHVRSLFAPLLVPFLRRFLKRTHVVAGMHGACKSGNRGASRYRRVVSVIYFCSLFTILSFARHSDDGRIFILTRISLSPSSADLETRKKYVALTESVKEANGEVHIFSTLHVSGERTSLLSLAVFC